MNEKDLIKLWHEKRSQIIFAQIAPSLVLIALTVLAVGGEFVDAPESAKYLAIGVAAVTGFLAIVSQYAAIREAITIVADLAAIKDLSLVGRTISRSRDFLSLMSIALVGLGLGIFALVVWSVLG
jgi:hypothetical protein